MRKSWGVDVRLAKTWKLSCWWKSSWWKRSLGHTLKKLHVTPSIMVYIIWLYYLQFKLIIIKYNNDMYVYTHCTEVCMYMSHHSIYYGSYHAKCHMPQNVCKQKFCKLLAKWVGRISFANRISRMSSTRLHNTKMGLNSKHNELSSLVARSSVVQYL